MAGALTGAAMLCLSAPAQAQGPGFQIVSDGPALELRFHGMPLRSVRADDTQNALSLDFNLPVDPAVFDSLARQLPQWVSMAYTSYDNGVIRATRPVTFLTRQETDGFSLRLQPREGAAPMQQAQAAPQPLPGQPYPQPMPPPQPGYPPQAGYPPGPVAEQPIPFAPYETYGAARNYYGLRYAVRRADPLWTRAYARAAAQGASDGGIGVEYKSFKNDDRLITARASARVEIGGGLALLGSITDVDSDSVRVRTATGALAADRRNVLTGSAGLGFALGGDTELALEGLIGNGTAGARLSGFSGTPDGFFSASLVYHQPLLDTAEALLNKARKDAISVAIANRLAWGLWGSLEARYANYGTSAFRNAVQTAGWDANLRWDYDLGGVMAGLSYDGMGEYRLAYTTQTGAAPTPYVPLSIRNMEVHSATMALSSQMFDGFWFNLYGGYAYDRYSSNGGIYGLSVRYTPLPGLDFELGARRSNVSLTQGMNGGETSAGLSMTLGFGGPPRASRLSLW